MKSFFLDYFPLKGNLNMSNANANTSAAPALSVAAIVDRNKATAISAGFMEAGRIANGQVAKFVGKKLPVMVRGYADTALGKLVLANLASIAVQRVRPGSEQLVKLTNAMMVQAYQQLLGEVDLEGMLDELLEHATIKRAIAHIEAPAAE
jgi:hypothetical protein